MTHHANNCCHSSTHEPITGQQKEEEKTFEPTTTPGHFFFTESFHDYRIDHLNIKEKSSSPKKSFVIDERDAYPPTDFEGTKK